MTRALALALALLAGCAPAEDDLSGDWFGTAECEEDIQLDVGLWFEVLSGRVWRGEASLVWDEVFEEDGWQFAIHTNIEGTLQGSDDTRGLELTLSSCEASPFLEYPCPESASLVWHSDGPAFDGQFEFGVPWIEADGTESVHWPLCEVSLSR